MDNELKKNNSVNVEDVMKIVKQPLFLIGAVAIVLSIVFAIIGSAINPSKPAVISKYEKALRNQDVALLSECYSPTAGVSSEELAYEIASFKFILMNSNISGDVEVEYLVGASTTHTNEKGQEITVIPAIRVITANGKIVSMSNDSQYIIKIGGKEYLYTGKEQ